MPNVLDQDQFIEAWNKCGGSPVKVSRATGINLSNIYARRARLAKRGIILKTNSTANNPHGSNGFGVTNWQTAAPAYKPRINLTLRDGYCVIFSDAHFWPGIRSLAFEGLLLILKELKPKFVISNGDSFDGASISRFGAIAWEKVPKVIEELDATKGFLWEVEKATPKAQHIFVVGNHDSRFDRRLASEVSEFEDVPGCKLQDHLKAWDFTWSALFNEDTDPFFVIHSIRGGDYAPKHNVLAAGCSVYTGHLHSQKVMPHSTLLRDDEGVDGGTLADKDGPQFINYRAARPANWREGFAIQRVDKDGLRYPAELVQVRYFKRERRLIFRGEVILRRPR